MHKSILNYLIVRRAFMPHSEVTHSPECDEILEGGGEDEDAVDHGVEEEEDEELVVREAHAVVHPVVLSYHHP